MKRTKKESREFEVLLGLIDIFLESGKPIGSQTLKESGFSHLSSATIRNYFSELEKKGFLHQPHSSGGRIPTVEGLRLYASEHYHSTCCLPGTEQVTETLKKGLPSKGIHSFLQQATHHLSELTGLASFLSSVRFDHDFIFDIRLLSIDHERILCVLLTDFGQILTEVLMVPKKLSLFALRRVERDLQWRVRGGKRPSTLNQEEDLIVKTIYDEIMVRYLVRYANFSEEEIHRTGFSHLLNYPEFSDPVALSTGLSLFENTTQMRLLLNDCIRSGALSYWIGSDLSPYAIAAKGCSILSIPYYIGTTKAGALGILGPCRIPYKLLFGTLKDFATTLSDSLTKTLTTFKLSFRQPRAHSSFPNLEVIEYTTHKLLEIKENES